MNTPAILEAFRTFVASHPDLVIGVLAYVVIGLLNGILPTKVDGATVTRMISAILDRVAPTTRKDAVGTFKLPLLAASILRGVADAIDPKDPPASGGTSARANTSTALALALALALASSSALHGCTPSPRPNGVYQPSGTLATIDRVVQVIAPLVTFLRPLVLSAIPSADTDGRRAADIAITAFEGSANAFLAGRRTWDLRAGAGYCDAYAATGAVTASLKNVIRTLGNAGVGHGPDLDALVDASGLLADRLAYCDPVFDAAVPTDADVDARAMLRARSVLGELRATIDDVQAAARDRGRSLSPLPAIH